jgi:uncharacterized protein
MGYVSDYAGVIDEATEAYLNGLLKELEEKTTAEIAVPDRQDDQAAGHLHLRDGGLRPLGGREERPGQWASLPRGDRRSRAPHLHRLWLEGILPDGKVGGDPGTKRSSPASGWRTTPVGSERGVEAFARIIAQEAGVELTGLTPGGEAEPGPEPEPSGELRGTLIAIVLLFFLFFWLLSRARRRGLQPRPAGLPWIFWSGRLGPGKGGWGSFGGGFSREGFGGFGGFGGGRSGGGGAGGRW